jgi:hypothetical protein
MEEQKERFLGIDLGVRKNNSNRILYKSKYNLIISLCDYSSFFCARP